MLRFQNIKPARRLAVILTDTAHRLDVQPRYALTRLDLAELDPDDAALIGDDQQGFGFVLDDRADNLAIRLLPETPDFGAEIDVQATISDGALREGYTIACNPESNKVDQVLIHFSSVREAEPEWMRDGGAAISTAQRLDADEQRSLGLPGSGETWRLRFRTPIDQRFVVSAQRSSPLGDQLSLSLASLPEATSQRGTVTVKSQSDVAFSLRHQRLRAIPPALHEPGGVDRVLGSFAFDPLDEAQRDSALELVRRNDQRLPAWIWNCTGNTWLPLAGPIRHSAQLTIETAGRASIQLQMAELVGEPRVLIDGRHEDRITFESKQSRLTIPLPSDRRDCCVLVEWAAPSVRPGPLMNAAIQPPEADVPVLARRWTLWLPPGYNLLDPPSKWGLAGKEHARWHERLFGGLARTQDQETFEPWLAHDWTLLGRQLSGSKGCLDAAEAFLAQLDVSDPTRSWSTRIDEAWSEAAAADQPLLVDFTALDRLGIQAHTTQQREQSIPATGKADHDLVVLAHHSASILTSQYRAAEVVDSSIASSFDRAFPLSDVLAEQMAKGNELTPFGDLISLEAWRSTSRIGPTTRASDIDDLDLTVTRWSPYSVELPEAQTLQLTIIRQPFVVALGYAALLITAGAAWLCARRPPLVRLAILGAAAIFALLVPETWIPLGSGVFLGLALGFASHWIARHVLKTPESFGAIVPSAAPTRAIPAAVLCIAMLIASQLGAVEPLESENANTPIFDILIPTDTQTEPRGKQIYVPEPFYKELIRITPRAKVDDAQWLITQARYESPRAENRLANGAVWIARYSLDVFGSSRVRVPLGRSGAHLLPQGAKLDEKPLQFELDEVNNEMVFDVTNAGSYKMRVEFVPIPPQGEGAPLIDFSIPAIPNSRLVLAPLPGIMRPVVNGYGMVAAPSDGNALICDLGPADKITIRNTEAAQMPQSAEFEATEMLWLNAGPGSLTLQGRWHVNVGRGTVRQLILELDPAAHLLPPDDASVISRVRPMSDGKHVQLEFREPVDDSIVFDLSFVLEPSAAPGRVTWPR